MSSAGRLLSTSEKEYIRLGVESDLRSDGRKRLDFRPFGLEVDVVPQAAGSARLRLGRTDILVSVKTDIGRPDLASPSHGSIACSVDAASGAAAAASAGAGSSTGDQDDRGRNDRLAELSTTLTALLRTSGGLDLSQLCIVPGRHCWLLHVDVLILDEDGNLLDAIVLASRAALARCRLPGVAVEEGGEETEIVLSDDPALSRLLDTASVPVTVTLCQLGASFVADATVSEEACSEAALSLAVDSAGSVLYTKKMLGGSIEPSRLVDMLHSGQRLAASILAALDAELSRSMQP